MVGLMHRRKFPREPYVTNLVPTIEMDGQLFRRTVWVSSSPLMMNEQARDSLMFYVRYRKEGHALVYLITVKLLPPKDKGT